MSDKRQKKNQRDSGFSYGNQKDTEAEIARRKQTRTAVGVLIAIAVIAVVVFILNTNLFYRNVTALNVDGQRFSITDMNYYASGGRTTFESAATSASQRTLLHNRAVAEGLTIDAEGRENIDTFLRSIAEDYHTFRDDWGMPFTSAQHLLLDQYGRGMNLNILRERLEFDFLGQMYVTHFNERLHASFTEEMLEEHYTENKDSYERIYYRAFTLHFATEEEMAELTPEELVGLLREEDVQVLAEDIRAAAEENGEEGFLTAVGRVMTEFDLGVDADTQTWRDEAWGMVEFHPFGDWLRNPSRTPGDVTVFEGEHAFTALYFSALEDNRYYTANVRHILIGFGTEADPFTGQPTPPTPEERAAAAAEADSVYAQWRSGPATEESFMDWVRETSDDYRGEPDPGFFGEINRQSHFVPEFRDWAVDEARRPGDVEIVETMFGFHIMYFVGLNTEMTHRHAMAQQAMSSEAFQEWLETATEAMDWRSTFFSRLVNAW